MQLSDSVIALLIVLVLIVIYCVYNQKKNQQTSKIPSRVFNVNRRPNKSPYTILNNQIDSLRGVRMKDGYNQTLSLKELGYGKFCNDGYHHVNVYSTPEQMAESEREQWYAASNKDCSGAFNTELTQDMANDTTQYHTTSPAIDYDKYIVDLVADPRVKQNHEKWLEEMKPWTGATMKVDNLDIEPYIDFIGLRRPQAVAQYNPMQITEADTWDLIQNPKFNFRG
jgi:hypothetical protein